MLIFQRCDVREATVSTPPLPSRGAIRRAYTLWVALQSHPKNTTTGRIVGTSKNYALSCRVPPRRCCPRICRRPHLTRTATQSDKESHHILKSHHIDNTCLARLLLLQHEPHPSG